MKHINSETWDMTGPVRCSHQSQWVGVCLLTHIQKQANTPAVLKAGDINPLTDHTSLRNISHQSLVRDDVITIDQNRLRELAR